MQVRQRQNNLGFGIKAVRIHPPTPEAMSMAESFRFEGPNFYESIRYISKRSNDNGCYIVVEGNPSAEERYKHRLETYSKRNEAGGAEISVVDIKRHDAIEAGTKWLKGLLPN
jgi:hypothetical protein